jgi:hypothetical protein
MTDDVTRLRLSLCPHCGAMLDAAVHIEEGSRPPEPGDVTMCGACAGVMVFDAHVVPRAPTPGEMEYARTEGAIRVHTNTAEGFFGLFKRGIFGIHHQVSPKHLHRYAAEHTFRYNGRKHDAAERIARCLIGRHGRLRLRELFA